MKNYDDIDILAYIYYTDEHFVKHINYLPITFEVFKVIRKEFNRFDKFYDRALIDVRKGKINDIKNRINVHRT